MWAMRGLVKEGGVRIPASPVVPDTFRPGTALPFLLARMFPLQRSAIDRARLLTLTPAKAGASIF